MRYYYRIVVDLSLIHISHIKDIIDASDIVLTREEWYSLYVAAQNPLP